MPREPGGLALASISATASWRAKGESIAVIGLVKQGGRICINAERRRAKIVSA